MATVAARPSNVTSVSSASWRRIPASEKLDLALRRPNETFCRKPSNDCFVVKTLERPVPEADVHKPNSNQWFQLGGHENSLQPSGRGSVYKLVSGADNMEIAVYEALNQDDRLRDLVPHFYKTHALCGGKYIEIQDLLYNFHNPHVMVLKMGTRTYLESDEIETEREDLYKKMVKQDPSGVTESERRIGKVTKKRYMEFREQKSSSAKLGFRIEGIKYPDKEPQTNFKNLGDSHKVLDTISSFLSGRPTVRKDFVERLKHIRECLERSEYFKRHEMVGTSLYLIYDETKFGAWLIDFGKTRRVPDGVELDHRTPWKPGTHEEGFLFGLDQMIKILDRTGSPPEVNARQDG